MSDIKIIQKPCADGNWQRMRAGLKPQIVVIHIADGSLAGTDAWFDTPPWERASKKASSAHYCVGKNGEIHQYVAEGDRAFHCGNVYGATAKIVVAQPKINPNLYAIGVEHEARAADTGSWPLVMVDASVALVADICARWKIPVDRDHIIGHHEIYSLKSCPGTGVNLDSYVAAVAARVKQKLGSTPGAENPKKDLTT